MNDHFSLKSYLEARQHLINTHLAQLIPQDSSPAAHLFKAIRYSLMAGGKRIRPILTLAAFEASNSTDLPLEAAIPFACALECIHTYSLIHDDLPAMDDDDLRRGMPTCHKVFGEALAILAGDGLLTLAFELCSFHEKTYIAPETQLKAINLIAQAAGIRGMVAGQAADIQLEGKDISPQELDYIHTHKTGALLKASVVLGGLIAHADASAMQALADYGSHIGLAFQIRDDILDIEGDEKTMGKTRGSDERKKKATYPAVHTLEIAKYKMQELCKQAKEDIAILGHGAIPLKAIAEYIAKRDR